jgi:hypothetical protein
MPTRKRKKFPWATWPEKKLLDTRLCDLGLQIEGTWIEECLEQLYEELAAKELAFRPHCWVSDEWFCPDGVPGFAIPFFLLHPRLRRLERHMMRELEGATHSTCMKLMRHETGHAVANAYLVHRKRSWGKHFGKSSQKYPETYLPNPNSKRFVIHLDNWYAQSHPHEDWAETFAVWLTPRSDWRIGYRGWSALRKLEYVDKVMHEIAGCKPQVRSRWQPRTLRTLRITLAEYYEKKKAYYGIGEPDVYDDELRKLFSDKYADRKNERGADYIQRVKPEVVEIVSRWTSIYRYRVNQVIQDMISRCDTLNLHVPADTRRMKLETVACLTMLVMSFLYNKRFHIVV